VRWPLRPRRAGRRPHRCVLLRSRRRPPPRGLRGKPPSRIPCSASEFSLMIDRSAMITARLRHAALAFVLLSPGPAFAQNGPPPIAEQQAVARAKAQAGVKLYGADRWEQALASFREADAAFHAPSVTIYIARCQRKMGR